MSWLCTTCMQCGEGILIEETDEPLCEACRQKKAEPKPLVLTAKSIALALRCHDAGHCASCPNREKLQMLADTKALPIALRKKECVRGLLLQAADIIENTLA